MTALASLCHRRQAPRQREHYFAAPTKDEAHADANDVTDFDYLQSNQCPWCLYDKALSTARSKGVGAKALEQRRYTYSQVSRLQRHIQKKTFRTTYKQCGNGRRYACSESASRLLRLPFCLL